MASGGKEDQGQSDPDPSPDGLPSQIHYRAEVRLVDLSTSGALIECDRSLKSGCRLWLQIPVDGDYLRVRASVVRSRVHRIERSAGKPARTIYRAGVSFLDLSPSDRQVIRRLITERLKSDSRHQPRVYVGAAGELEMEIEIKVIDLGLKGGLFEARQPLALYSQQEFRFRLPGAEVQARGLVRHCQAWAVAAGEPTYEIGVEFVDFHRDGKEKVLAYLEELAREGNRRRD